MCSFCNKIYTYNKDLPNNVETCLVQDQYKGTVDILVATEDPFWSGELENISFCPYCGQNVQSLLTKNLINVADSDDQNNGMFEVYVMLPGVTESDLSEYEKKLYRLSKQYLNEKEKMQNG